MQFEWDERKRRANLPSTGLFQTPVVERQDERRNCGESRTVAYGEVDGIVLCVIYTWRDGARRIISARRARKR
jgi:uncharacterized protein